MVDSKNRKNIRYGNAAPVGANDGAPPVSQRYLLFCLLLAISILSFDIPNSFQCHDYTSKVTIISPTVVTLYFFIQGLPSKSVAAASLFLWFL